jgi:uncharacterized protein (TIGR00255 family)
MIHSMTAFARESTNTEHGTITVELRSVNHRYLDCSFKLPDVLRALEPQLREQASKGLGRGKLDCLIRVQSHAARAGNWQVDTQQLDRLLEATRGIEAKLEDIRPLNALEILQFPGICSSEDESEEALQKTAAALFARALEDLRSARRREGEKLAQLVGDRLEQVAQEVGATRKGLPALLQQQRDRVAARIQELDVEVDQGRLEQELVYMAQKADVDEELDRLDAHISEVRRTLEKGGPCGRRLDFLMQEFNREANTLSSKSTSSDTTRSAVELKVLIEQMREQIQNIE